MPRSRLRRLRERAARIAVWVCITSLFGAAALSIGLTAAVHHTAQSEFCNSCHIMEPYYTSWQHSSHHDVACIECHYEPGTLETLEGKFKALSQLAKYVTRTAGTKPWAEVSDASCMRSGCHSLRMLDGPVEYGRVAFDHRHHLLESRRGRRLRCVTCHSQIVQGEHISVTSSVCFTCHFMPNPDGSFPETTGDCGRCHGAPTEDVLVEGRAFRHADFVRRGVDCRECHDPVVDGDGRVRKERCHSCHGEVGHIERISETAFLHEKHVTEHKVECFECHDEIHHGLLPIEPIRPAAEEGCGSCHESPHEAAQKLYAGTGAVGVPDEPSRMHETRVVCRACHTGRSGREVTEAARSHGALAHAAGASEGVSLVASAGDVDCIHCHGTGYHGMLTEWQAAVGEQLDRLEPRLGALEALLDANSDPAARKAVEEARHDYLLVALDGSRGVHNVAYALDVLRATAVRMDSASSILGLDEAAPAAEGFPFRTESGCSSCHASVGRPAAISPAERVFPHARHLAAGLDCSVCHSVERHGQPAFPRSECGSCHHQEAPGRDLEDCASCHAAQDAMLRGSIAGFAELKGPMSDMDCYECHGEAPDVIRPGPQACVLCHEAGYDATRTAWADEVAALVARVRAALTASPPPDPGAAEAARRALAVVESDGSAGAHNVELAKRVLEGALAGLEAGQR